MTQTAALRKRVTHAVLASVAIFTLAITYWGVNTFQQSEASPTTTKTTITFEEYPAPREMGTQSEYLDKGVKFSNNAGATERTTALSKEGAQCSNGVFTGEQLATSGSNRLHPYPNVSDPLVITFTDNRVTTDVSLQLLGVGDSKNLVEFFDHKGTLIEKQEYSNPGAGAGCDKKQLVSLTKPNIAKIRISQPDNSFATTQDGLAIDDLSFATLGSPVETAFSVSPASGAAPLAVKATYTVSTVSTSTTQATQPATQAITFNGTITWGDGQTAPFTTSTAEHTYTTPGTYQVVLSIDGQEVGRQAVSVTQTQQQDPSVTLSVSKDTYKPGETVQLTLRNGGPGAVELPNAAPFNMQRPDGTSVFSPIATQAIRELTAGQSSSWTWNQRGNDEKQVADGTYVAVVRYAVNGAQKTKQVTFAITKDGVVPPFEGTFSVSPTTGTLPLQTTFTCTSKNETALTDLTVDWGDGTVISDTTCPITLTHTYTNQGEYTVKVMQSGRLLGSQKVSANVMPADDGKSAPKALASTGANLLIVLIIAAVLSGLISYFILRRPFHGTPDA